VVGNVGVQIMGKYLISLCGVRVWDGFELQLQLCQWNNCANEWGSNVQGTKARADERYQFLTIQGNALCDYRDGTTLHLRRLNKNVFIRRNIGSKPYVNT